ncbi:MAG: glycosyltransferase family 4 protein [Bacteroidales bacterium]|jgi:glycosyltransferase involved in cell wall biosynthesis|nr:glycosyltransferase family 4 protein [Bacteroidales bacterium]
MKVLMFGWEFPPHITGGLGTASYGLCKGLLKQGMEVIFTVPKLYGDEDNSVAKMVGAENIEVDFRHPVYKEVWSKLTYIAINARLIPYVGLDEYYSLQKSDAKGSVGGDGFKRKFSFSGKYQANLIEEVYRYAMVASTIASEQEFDVIHAHDWLTYQAGIEAKRVSGKPLVIHVHATEYDRSGENVNPLVYSIEREGMLAADRIITVSNLTRQTVIDRYGIDSKKVVTVHNAVEPTDDEAKKSLVAEKHISQKVVTFLGRLTFQKGPEYFIEAAHKILEKDDDVRFVVAGAGDMYNKMVERVAGLRIGSRVLFTGFLKGLEVDKMFLLSDVYVMPSVSEPFGISPLEAMRSHVPVVISKQSGVSEILNYALKVDFWDVGAMADAVYALLHYSALSSMFKKYGTVEVDNLKWENAAKKVVNVYKDALNG